jgi:hypothetical protein
MKFLNRKVSGIKLRMVGWIVEVIWLKSLYYVLVITVEEIR